MNVRGIILLPVSILYGIITFFRNVLFDIGIFREKKHKNIITISVGNLSMGGTGKTPMVEYLIESLQDKYKIATLSRGYGRKTSGFKIANEKANAKIIGDEPMQYYSKYEKITVAVDGKRNRGVSKLIKANNELQIIALDDAFQHRWIKPNLSILLTDYHKMFHNDFVFPSGSLREFKWGSKRADIIVVTKTPVVLSPITRRRISDELNLETYQKLVFSKVVYSGLKEWNTNKLKKIPGHYSTIILFTGIANSYPLQEYLYRHCNEIIILTFPDHHDFKEKDINLLLKTYNDLFTLNKILVTTEKDIQRLEVSPKKEVLAKLPIFYAPIHVSFHDEDDEVISKSISQLFRVI